MSHFSSVIDPDDGWSGVDTWEDSGILSVAESSEAQKELNEVEEKLAHEEERYASLAASAKDCMEEMSGLLSKVKLSTASKDEMARLAKLEEEMNLLKDDVTETKSAIKSWSERKVRSLSKTKTIEHIKVTKEHDVRAVARFVREAEAVDLAFILDCTGSMGKYIDAAKSSIKEIVSRVKHTNPDLSLRLAVVGYRDISDPNRFEVLDFTSSVVEFKLFVSKLVAEGGADAPEDIAGAFQKANALSWTQTSRIAFLICDYPCHGIKYHDYTYPDDDYYPDGTPGICIESEIEMLKQRTYDDSGELNIYFGRVNDECDKMIRCFNKSGAGIEVCDLDDPQKLTKAVSSSVRKSISKSVETSRSRSQSHSDTMQNDADAINKYEICEALPSKEDWSAMQPSKVNFLCNKPINSVDDLMAPLLFGVIRRGPSVSASTETKTMLVQRAKNPFAQGEMRLAYYGRIGADEKALENPKALKVLKEFKRSSSSARENRKQYLAQMEVSTIANFLAKEYNHTSRPDHCAQLRFLDVIVGEVDERSFDERFCAEDLLPNESFTKFSNNTGYWNEEEINQSLLLFTRFTAEKTGGYLMVTDLQGVRNGNEYVLTDPAILCKDIARFGGNNLGEIFIKKCMKSTQAMLEEYGWDA